MAGTDGNFDVGGGIPPQAATSYADDEAAMRSGKGRMMAGIIGISVVVAVGAVLLLTQGGSADEYREAGKLVNGPAIRGNFDTFWGCALQGVNLRDLSKADELIAQINMRGSEGGKTYGKYIQDMCISKLSDMQSKLDVISLPSDLQTDLGGLKEASSQLRSAWSAYISFLTDTKAGYDEEQARNKIKDVARGWYEFKKAHSSINQKLKEQIE